MEVFQKPIKNWSIDNIQDMTGKICVITGGSSGIGREDALALATKNAEIYLVARNREKGEKIKNEIIAKTGNNKVFFYPVDLSSLESIREFSLNLHQKVSKVDILINNAGIMMPAKRILTKDGFELMWATNYLGGFYLSFNILDLLKKSKEARIINLASLSTGKINMNFNNFDGHKYNPSGIYFTTKFAQALIARKLNALFSERKYNIKVMGANPGIASTNLITRKAGATSLSMVMGEFLFKVFPFFRQSAEKGALPTLYAATSSKAQGGAIYSPHFHDYRGYPGLWRWNNKKEMNDQEIQDRLFNNTLKVLNIDEKAI